MRAAFGLVGILVVVGVIAVFWGKAYLPYTQQVITQGQSAQQQAQQIAGIDQFGGRVTQTIAFEPISMQGKLRFLMVKWMRPGSSYATYYGIFPGDLIETIGPQNVRDIDDAELARDQAYEAYQRKWDLVILRNNQQFTLPRDSAAAAALLAPAPAPGQAPAATGQPTAVAQPQPTAAQPAAPQPPQKSGNSLYDQLDAIRNYNQGQ